MASQHESSKAKAPAGQPAMVRRTNLRPAIEIHWSDLDAQKLRGAVDAITRRGCAVIFGITSDGGALSVCILDKDSKIREYPHTVLEAEQLLAVIMEEYTS